MNPCRFVAAEPIAGRDAGGRPGLLATEARAGRSRWLLFGGLAATVAVVDQIVKAIIVANFEVNRIVPVIGEYARIVVSHNSGALFGLFRDQAPIFALFSLLVIGVIVWYQSRAGGTLLVTLALGLLLGGAVGNLLDRLRLGYVVDFVDLGIGSWRFYTFNVADMAISGSILLLLLLAIRPERPSRVVEVPDV
jgi:signal peptidase II